MSSNFPKIPQIVDENCVVGEDFKVVKKSSNEKYSRNVFKFTNDRFIPSKSVNSECLHESNDDDFDIFSSENNIKTMKKSQYQKSLKLLFYNQRDGNKSNNSERNDTRNNQSNKSLIHLDWACKFTNIREKFLPDFETLEKKSFHQIQSYIWSSRNIIAASSSRKVCLYHPKNGYTRALDISDNVTIAFSNSGVYLAMAYKRSHCFLMDDLFIFQIDEEVLFNSEKLNTEKIQTTIEYDITALCFTRNDSYLMCGTNIGKIYVLECRPEDDQNESNQDINAHQWSFLKPLSNSHNNAIVKICFSATSLYMATLDITGKFKIWNGGSWTYMFSYQHQESRLFKHFEWHPFVENELIFGKRKNMPSIYLFNVTQKKVVASYSNWKEDWELSSVAFNPVTAQLAVCFYNDEEYINRVSLLASMSQVISSFDFDYIKGGMKLFWNSDGLMLGAGAQSFRFAFWSFYKNNDFHDQMSKAQKTKNSDKILTMRNSRMLNIR